VVLASISFGMLFVYSFILWRASFYECLTLVPEPESAFMLLVGDFEPLEKSLILWLADDIF
jgi:hypothetical protein